MAPPSHSGFISIFGSPNVGKSTLLNRLIGESLAAVSRKPQTTRGVVRGILTTPEGQAIFLDTPGFYDPRDRLGEWMMSEIRKSLQSADLIYWMVLPKLPGGEEQKLISQIKGSQVPIFLLINQVDRVAKPEILPVIGAYQRLYNFREIIPISALQGDNLPVLMRKTFEALPENPPYFPEELITDQNERTIVAEMIREKIFRFTGEEIPYSSALEIEEFKERSDQLVFIKAVIVVEKDSQKSILIGKGGAKIKQIGFEARREIERFLGRKVFLELWVKTLRNWKKDPQALKRLGFGL